LTAVKLTRNICNMGTREVARGPVSQQVSHNVSELRRKRGMSLTALSEEMSRVGRPILSTGLSKIETGERRVDVDDLVALALALGVSPARLLLPGREGPVVEPPDGIDEDFLHRPRAEPVALTPDLSLPWRSAWDWASGEEPMLGIDRHGDWEAENRPQGRTSPTAGELQRLGREAEGVALMFERSARLLLEASAKVRDGGDRG
jgi:transcriptional regulator with XRE-family HTH domain